MRAVGYVRVSSKEQKEEGVSLDAQEERIRMYAQLRGLELDEMLVDGAVSAGKPLESRPQGQALLSAIQSGEVSTVIACKLDRLFRDTIECLSVLEAWEEQGVGLHLIDVGGQALDTTSAMGKFFVTMLAALAEMERNRIRERTREALAHKKANGERVGHIPYGWSLVANDEHHRDCEDEDCTGCLHIEEDDNEQTTIRYIQELRYGDEKLSIRAIAARLRLEEITNRGRRWTRAAVNRLLKRER